MACVDLHVVEHIDCLGECFAVKVAACPISGHQIAGTIDNARVQFGVFKDDGTKEAYTYFAERFVSWKQVGAVEVAEDPV